MAADRRVLLGCRAWSAGVHFLGPPSPKMVGIPFGLKFKTPKSSHPQKRHPFLVNIMGCCYSCNPAKRTREAGGVFRGASPTHRLRLVSSGKVRRPGLAGKPEVCAQASARLSSPSRSVVFLLCNDQSTTANQRRANHQQISQPPNQSARAC